VPSTVGLKAPWRPGQSGNPAARAKGAPTLRTRLRRLDDEAFAALERALKAQSRAVQLAAFKVWSELRIQTATPKDTSAARQLLDGNFTEAQLTEMEERARLLSKNEGQ